MTSPDPGAKDDGAPPLLSVVVPVHNRSQLLARALQSLEQQEFRDFEVVVCDDGSTEDLGPVLAASRLQALQVLRIAASGSPARPRNQAIARARGTWIAFLDSDDGWRPERLATVVPQLDDHCDVLYHPLAVERDASQPGGHARVFGRALGPDALGDLLTLGNPIPNSACVVRRELLLQIGGICEERPLIEDYDTWIRLAVAGARFRFLPVVLGWYQAAAGTQRAASDNQVAALEAIYRRHLDHLPVARRASALARRDYVIGVYRLELGQPRAALAALWQARPLRSLVLRIKRAMRMVQALWAMARRPGA